MKNRFITIMLTVLLLGNCLADRTDCSAWWSWSPPGEHSTHHKISDNAYTLVSESLTTAFMTKPDWISATYPVYNDINAHGGNEQRNGGDIEQIFSLFLASFNSGSMSSAYTYLGYCLHLIADMHVPAHAYNIKHAGLDTSVPDLFEYAARNMSPADGNFVVPAPDAYLVARPTILYHEAISSTKSTVSGRGFAGYYHTGSRGGEYADWNGDGPKGYYTVGLGTVYETVDFDLFPSTSASGMALIQYQLDQASRTSALFLRAVDTLLAYTPAASQSAVELTQGSDLLMNGNGFVPYGTASIYIRNPDSSVSAWPAIAIDSAGQFSVSHASLYNAPFGQYSWWAIDNANGKKTAESTYRIVPPASLLSLQFSGTGSGIITVSPGEVSTDTGIILPFPQNSTLFLKAIPLEYSTFSGWSGNTCTTSPDCAFAITRDTTLTATFEYDRIHQVRINRSTPEYYPTVSQALAAMISGETIQAWGVTLDETITVTIPVTIKGGYNSDYTSADGKYTIIHGSVVIRGGRLILDNLVIQ